MVGQLKKSPARRTQRGSRADLEAGASRPRKFSHKRKLLDVIAITFWRERFLSTATDAEGRGRKVKGLDRMSRPLKLSVLS
jgi:hypothetical protein